MSVIRIGEYEIVYQAHSDMWSWGAINEAINGQNNVVKIMWSKVELIKEMKAAGWSQHLDNRNLFQHEQTGYELDIDSKVDGRFLWLDYALAHETPAPF